MEERLVSKPHLIKTPIHNITIGEPLKKPDGHYSLRIKKPKVNEYEELPLDYLISMVVTEAESQPVIEQVPRFEGAARQPINE